MGHSKRYEAVAAAAPKEKTDVAGAVDFIQKNSTEKFDPTLELHVRLGIDAKKSDQSISGSVSLPAGTGKTVKVAAA